MAIQQKPESTAMQVATPKAVVKLLDSEDARRRIVPMLAEGVDYDRVMLEVYYAAQKNADILKCAPASIVRTVAQAVATGGRIGRDIHLVPFGQTLEMIEDYKFLIEIIVRSGGARSIIAKCVYENEEFHYAEGTSVELRHVPIMDAKKRGRLAGAYAIARVAYGNVVIVPLAAGEIDAIRQKYSKSWKRGTLDDIPWYALKTVVRQLAKILPKNPRLAAALQKLGIGGEREQEEEGEANEATTEVTRLLAAATDEDRIEAPEQPDASAAESEYLDDSDLAND